MKVAVVGFSQSGRSTLYRAAARGQAKGSLTAVPVPDPRFDAIVSQVKPKKATPATVIFDDDMEALQPRGRMFTPQFLEDARKSEVLLLVVRAFENPVAPYHAEVDPLRDLDSFEVEAVITDLQLVETRLERLQKSSTVKTSGSPDYLEKQLFERLREPLESGTPILKIETDEDETRVLANHQFLTAKPWVVAFNVNEEAAAAPDARIVDAIGAQASKGRGSFALAASLEEELSQLDPADQVEFLAGYGLTEPASARLIKASYDALGLITFFTAGENETRAWALRRGSNAVKAAATIHNDIAKGFIRAEVVSFEQYTAHGSLDAAYKGGSMRLEGKEYTVHDGDLLHIRNKS